MQLTSASHRSVGVVPNRQTTVTSLLVEPDTTLLDSRKALLEGFGCAVGTACTSCEVFQLQLEHDPNIVVLSDALGDFHLRALAEYVRHRWPFATIVVIGNPLPALEDQLYDECVPAQADPTELATAIARCTRISKRL